MSDLEQVKEIALQFRKQGAHATRELSQKVARVFSEITVLSNSSLTPTGTLPSDFYAPSVWHAMCFLLVSESVTRVTQSKFSADDETFESFFGNRPVYRGQSRPWNILPTSWRAQDSAEILNWRLKLFGNYLLHFMAAEDAVELDLFGRPQTQGEVNALAQHYSLATSLVDFTFDPMIALYFACDHCEAGPLLNLADDLLDCAVVYFVPFVKLVQVSHSTAITKPSLTFPPVQARRLFRQGGFFLDYGDVPQAIPSTLDFSEPWMWVQQNCGRIFFPREYPDFTARESLGGKEILQSEPFFEALAKEIKELRPSNIEISEFEILSTLRSRINGRPPWRVKHLDGAFFYTDEEFAAIASYLVNYVRRAALVEMAGEQHLDPLVIAKIGEFDTKGVMALKTLSEIPFVSHHNQSLQWTVEKVLESMKCMDRYMNASGTS